MTPGETSNRRLRRICCPERHQGRWLLRLQTFCYEAILSLRKSGRGSHLSLAVEHSSKLLPPVREPELCYPHDRIGVASVCSVHPGGQTPLHDFMQTERHQKVAKLHHNRPTRNAGPVCDVFFHLDEDRPAVDGTYVNDNCPMRAYWEG